LIGVSIEATEGLIRLRPVGIIEERFEQVYNPIG